MRFIKNEAFPEDSDYLLGLREESVDDSLSVYRSPEDGNIKYLIISVKFMLNLLYECEDVTLDAVREFAYPIIQAATEIVHHCITPEHERARVREICEIDNLPPDEFSAINATEIESAGCALYHDNENDTWCVQIDGVVLHHFEHEHNARRVFEYAQRDVRQSSEKWLSAIYGTPARF